MNSKKWCLFITLLVTSAVPTVSAQNVGITPTDFQNHYRIQRTLTWCWASSAEMVLSYAGINMPQDAIVTRVRGIAIPGGANPYEMINSTNGVFQDSAGGSIVVSGQFVQGAPTTAVLYNQLKNNRPVVLTYQNGPWSGHAVVLTGADATIGPAAVQITRLYVFDPFPFAQQMTSFGPQLIEDRSLVYQQLDLHQTFGGLQLIRNGIPIGLLSGMILVDASK